MTHKKNVKLKHMVIKKDNNKMMVVYHLIKAVLRRIWLISTKPVYRRKACNIL